MPTQDTQRGGIRNWLRDQVQDARAALTGAMPWHDNFTWGQMADVLTEGVLPGDFVNNQTGRVRPLREHLPTLPSFMRNRNSPPQQQPSGPPAAQTFGIGEDGAPAPTGPIRQQPRSGNPQAAAPPQPAWSTPEQIAEFNARSSQMASRAIGNQAQVPSRHDINSARLESLFSGGAYGGGGANSASVQSSGSGGGGGLPGWLTMQTGTRIMQSD